MVWRLQRFKLRLLKKKPELGAAFARRKFSFHFAKKDFGASIVDVQFDDECESDAGEEIVDGGSFREPVGVGDGHEGVTSCVDVGEGGDSKDWLVGDSKMGIDAGAIVDWQETKEAEESKMDIVSDGDVVDGGSLTGERLGVVNYSICYLVQVGMVEAGDGILAARGESDREVGLGGDEEDDSDLTDDADEADDEDEDGDERCPQISNQPDDEVLMLQILFVCFFYTRFCSHFTHTHTQKKNLKLLPTVFDVGSIRWRNSFRFNQTKLSLSVI